ncbi:restriction endonuclease subunit S [Photobacterium phosphoreum]|uniref:restriction endonuclease subunit S n=1 Tax=Photobacterium phosphoreum TaxID=659 RepID=UPI000D16832E|nr:restriction endonuclease subunit S [Photobacterium phosphoreum]PSU59988.1 hypothetical protein CTM80_15250 [Photobacterium phosphoreum]
MNDLVPEGWKKVTLASISNIIMGQSPSSETYNDKRLGLPFFQGKADFGSHYPKVRVWCSEPSKIANKGAILFSVRAPVGDINLSDCECCIGRGLAAISGDKVVQSYLYQTIKLVKSEFQLLAQGSTFEAINGSELRDFKLTIPPLPEQQKIATILTSIDDVIEKTQLQINKLKDLKTGMMQELLTRGVGIDGEPHTEFKDSPKWTTGKISEITKIPLSWELVNINDVARLESGHTPSRDNVEYWGGEYQWLSLHDTKELNTPIIKKTKLSITQAGLDNSSARLLPIGTVAFSRTASVGHCVMFGKSMATSQDFANYVCGEKLSPRYLLQLFRWMQHVWNRLSEGSTHKTIYMPTFKKLQILLPPIKEQFKIADIIESIDNDINKSIGKLYQYKNLKKALMHDLLTGKVRVNVD